jgi:hypothetical protein
VFRGGTVQEAVGPIVGLQQGLDMLAKSQIFGASLIKEGSPFSDGGPVQGFQENGFDLLWYLRHLSPSVERNSFRFSKPVNRVNSVFQGTE